MFNNYSKSKKILFFVVSASFLILLIGYIMHFFIMNTLVVLFFFHLGLFLLSLLFIIGAIIIIRNNIKGLFVWKEMVIILGLLFFGCLGIFFSWEYIIMDSLGMNQVEINSTITSIHWEAGISGGNYFEKYVIDLSEDNKTYYMTYINYRSSDLRNFREDVGKNKIWYIFRRMSGDLVINPPGVYSFKVLPNSRWIVSIKRISD